jgi:hypothetical protein
MEGYCSTGQSPQRAVVPVEEEEGGKYSNHGAVKYSSALSGGYFLLIFFLFCENARYIFRLILGFMNAISVS